MEADFRRLDPVSGDFADVFDGVGAQVCFLTPRLQETNQLGANTPACELLGVGARLSSASELCPRYCSASCQNNRSQEGEWWQGSSLVLVRV